MSEYIVMMDNSAGPGVAVTQISVPEISEFRLEDHLDAPTDLVADVVDIKPSPIDEESSETPLVNQGQESETIEETTELGAGSFFEFMTGDPALNHDGNSPGEGLAREEGNWELPVSFYHLYVLADEDERTIRSKNDRSSRNRGKQDRTP